MQDTGIGISADLMNCLFKPFSQIDASITRRYGGTGLGLVICDRLSEMMGGRIWVESSNVIGGNPPAEFQINPSKFQQLHFDNCKRSSNMVNYGENINFQTDNLKNPKNPGSTFYFTIIAPGFVGNKAEEVIFPDEDIKICKINPELPQMPLRILLAEDNYVNQKVAMLTLEHLGYKADVVNNGCEVLAALEQQTYDLILMDIAMPEMDGITATQMIVTKYPPSQRPKIIAMTALAMAGDRQKCINAGMDDYLSKPLQIEELLRVLNSLNNCQAVSVKNNLILPEHTQLSISNYNNNFTNYPINFTGNFGNNINHNNDSLDEKVLESLRKMAGAKASVILKQIINNYLEDAPELWQKILTAITAKDGEELKNSAHTLRSSSANLGAMKLANLCKQLENLGRSGNIANANEFISAAEAEYHQVISALKMHLQQLE